MKNLVGFIKKCLGWKTFEEKQDEEVKRILAQADAEIARMSPEELEKAADFKSDPKFYEFLRKYAYKEPPDDLKEKTLRRVFGDSYKVEKK